MGFSAGVFVGVGGLGAVWGGGVPGELLAAQPK
jgi:hypothetical protein